MTVWLLLAIGLGGCIGSIARYTVTALVQPAAGSAFPYGTLVVNVTGCFAAGLVGGLLEARALSETSRAFLLIGVLGGFTTFSAFGNDTVVLARSGATGAAATNVVASVMLTLAAVSLGRVIIDWLR
jgi:CrcB protein